MNARVRVPATSSNLGAGFDCIGIAVDRWLVASVSLGGTGIAIRRGGTLSAVRVRADQDLFTRGFRAACAAGGASPPGGGATIEATSDIPVGCGLGSSAAAIVAGALLATMNQGFTRIGAIDFARTGRIFWHDEKPERQRIRIVSIGEQEDLKERGLL